MKSLLAKQTQSQSKLKTLPSHNLVRLQIEGFKNPISPNTIKNRTPGIQPNHLDNTPFTQNMTQTEVSSTSQVTNSKHLNDPLKHKHVADQLSPELFSDLKSEISLLTSLLDKKSLAIEQLKRKLEEKNAKIKLLERENEILKHSNQKLLSVSIQAIKENNQKNKESETVRYNLVEKLQGLTQENEQMAKALREQTQQDRPLNSDRSSLFREELEAIQKRAYFSQEGLTLIKDEVQPGASNRSLKNESFSRKDQVKKEAIRIADELEAAVQAEREERIRAFNKSKESLARRKESVVSRKSADQFKNHNTSMALNNSSEVAANFSEVEDAEEHKKSTLHKSSHHKPHKNNAEEALGLAAFHCAAAPWALQRENSGLLSSVEH
jgi:myosin heavy subunit